MSGKYADLDGVLGIGEDAEGRAFYLRITAGELTFDKSGKAFDHIQVVLFQTAAPGRPADASDMFETDGLDGLAAELRRGILDWYGERLAFRLPTPAERDLIHAATGWPQAPKAR
ncbi:hypothetical protein EF912_33000 [Streptomyces sp. WAC07061]|uniref:hypothetical protein n=1 Tax=Streptomyces sp. WAC07061 TaxID=2487410 RepID=UPI000F7842BC|nr:hypothetical protein [Streptomyces sp. WAC07061]RSS39631.1 hypothetical protein EF912_33000 [Streptomyces sp. WAC07061]